VSGLSRVLTTGILLAAVWLPAGMVAAQERAGDVIVATAARDGGTPLTEGAAATEFRLLLPEGAACTGDSLNDNFRAETFVVPADVAPGDLRFSVSGPEPFTGGTLEDAMWPLYSNRSPFSAQLTQANASAGEPGTIGDLPPFAFTDFTVEQVPAGSYLVGVACTLPDRTVDRYWDATLQIDEDPAVEGGAIRWVVSSGQPVELPEGSDSSGSAWPVLVASGAAGIVLVALVVRRRASSTSSPTPQKEST
jgi:hypothetical protein